MTAASQELPQSSLRSLTKWVRAEEVPEVRRRAPGLAGSSALIVGRMVFHRWHAQGWGDLREGSPVGSSGRPGAPALGREAVALGGASADVCWRHRFCDLEQVPRRLRAGLPPVKWGSICFIDGQEK